MGLGAMKGTENNGHASRRLPKGPAETQVEFLQSLLDGISSPIMAVDASFRVIFVNQAAASHGRGEDAGAPGVCYRFLFGFDQPCGELGYPCPLREVLASCQPVTVTQKHRLASGKIRYFEIQASPLVDEQGRLSGVIESFRDISLQKKAEEDCRRDHEEMELQVAKRTIDLVQSNEALHREIEERRRAEAELRQAKEDAELVYRLIPSVMFTVDTQQRITSWNNKAEEVTGYSREEILGRKCDFFSLKPCTSGCGLFSKRVAKPIVGRECEIKTRSGQVRVISKNADLLRNAAGEVIGGIESFEDITDRIEVANMLRTERDKLLGMLAALGQGMHILNADFDIEYQNQVLVEHFGDKIGHKCYQVYKQLDQPCKICRMHKAIHSGRIQRTELLMTNDRYYEQSYAPFRDADGNTKALILLRDITEEKAFQAEALRAGQLASIGELAAGVAHEINNPINGIINYAQILLDEQEANKPAAEILSRVIKEGERISGIVSNLLSFARQGGQEIDEVAVARVLDDSVALVKNQLLKDGIQIAICHEQELPAVMANAQQLQQVFLNLLSNARYALNQRYAGRHDGKQIQIRSQVIVLGGSPYVRISVTDYGTGIPSEIIDHIFKPFYSRKKPGEGTGLGLSISHGLVMNFDGFLWVDSKVNEYTTMTVDLPALSEDSRRTGTARLKPVNLNGNGKV
jgi:PAS domain S-box-containing protein